MGTFGAYFDFKGSTYLIHTIDCLCTVCTYMQLLQTRSTRQPISCMCH